MQRSLWLGAAVATLAVLSAAALLTDADRHLGPSARPEPSGPLADAALIHVRRFGVNGLLAPLLDDAEPVRWSTAALPLFCGSGTSLDVDGQPLRPGTVVPARPFTLQWQMEGCTPFGETSVILDGRVELTVSPRGREWFAVIDGRSLRVTGRDGSARTAGVFGGTLKLGPPPSQ